MLHILAAIPLDIIFQVFQCSCCSIQNDVIRHGLFSFVREVMLVRYEKVVHHELVDTMKVDRDDDTVEYGTN